jgi:acyl-CoA dehydrogenase
MKPYRSPWLDQDLELYRDTVARFVEQEMLPHDERWRKAKSVGHDIWRSVGAQGFLLSDVSVEYGGAGGDYRHEAVFMEEMTRRGISGFGVGVHSICAHYVLNHGTEAQKQRWLPRMARGELVGAIAMTEPGAGSDLKNIRTRAVLDGDQYVVTGSKIFITNGSLAEILMLVVRTDPTTRKGGLSILMVETRDLKGYRVGRVLDKMGMHAQDTSELFFDEVRVHRDCLLGQEGQGMHQLMHDLPYERLGVAVSGVAAMEGGLAATIDYVRGRQAFGQTLASMQTVRHRLADLATRVRVARVFVDDCIQKQTLGTLDTETASMAKFWISEQQQSVLDDCVQLHGGYGFMTEYLVCRMFADSRVQRIYAGTNEIMKEVISRTL